METGPGEEEKLPLRLKFSERTLGSLLALRQRARAFARGGGRDLISVSELTASFQVCFSRQEQNSGPVSSAGSGLASFISSLSAATASAIIEFTATPGCGFLSAVCGRGVQNTPAALIRLSTTQSPVRAGVVTSGLRTQKPSVVVFAHVKTRVCVLLLSMDTIRASAPIENRTTKWVPFDHLGLKHFLFDQKGQPLIHHTE